MKLLAPFGIFALLPAAFNISAAAGAVLTIPVCTGDGLVHMVNVPAGSTQLPGNDGNGCCAKGCHTGGSRKRMADDRGNNDQGGDDPADEGHE